jgi:hypothetical protein
MIRITSKTISRTATIPPTGISVLLLDLGSELRSSVRPAAET